MNYSTWDWIVEAIRAIETCGKARRLVYAVVFLLMLGWALPNFISALR
jgi:hypothetical protein